MVLSYITIKVRYIVIRDSRSSHRSAGTGVNNHHLGEVCKRTTIIFWGRVGGGGGGVASLTILFISQGRWKTSG